MECQRFYSPELIPATHSLGFIYVTTYYHPPAKKYLNIFRNKICDIKLD